MSLSSRRAWIEIHFHAPIITLLGVALLTESVDWNNMTQTQRSKQFLVALLTESVDWNKSLICNALSKLFVALLTESVDWNTFIANVKTTDFAVALLTESVDWNCPLSSPLFFCLCRSPHGERGLKFCLWLYLDKHSSSLSSRRAWIEITAVL